MTHEEIKILISAYADGEVTPSEKTNVEEHLSTCPDCQKDYKMYPAMSSSLSKWPNETLSPDEEIKVQRHIEQRREPMFTKRSLMTIGTTLALAIMVGSVVQLEIQRGSQGRLKSAADDLGDQYSNVPQARESFDKHLATGMLAATNSAPLPYQSSQYQPGYGGQFQAMSKKVDYAPQVFRAGLDVSMSPPPVAAAQQEMAGSETDAIMVNTKNRAVLKGLTEINNENQRLINGWVERQAQPKIPERKIIQNAQVTLTVDDAEKTHNDLEDIVNRYNGLIINSQFQGRGNNDFISQMRRPFTDQGAENGLLAHGYVIFKVQPKDFRKVLLDIRKLGKVTFENQSGEDITQQYLDLQSKIENYNNIMDRLHKLLEKSTHEEVDLQEVEEEITRVEGNIHSTDDMIKLYEANMSTLTVIFWETNDVLKKLHDNWDQTSKNSYDAFINTSGRIVVIFSYAFPAIVLLLIIWRIYYFVRKNLKK